MMTNRITIRTDNLQKVKDLIGRLPEVWVNPNPSFVNIDVTQNELSIIGPYIYSDFLDGNPK